MIGDVRLQVQRRHRLVLNLDLRSGDGCNQLRIIQSALSTGIDIQSARNLHIARFDGLKLFETNLKK